MNNMKMLFVLRRAHYSVESQFIFKSDFAFVGCARVATFVHWISIPAPTSTLSSPQHFFFLDEIAIIIFFRVCVFVVGARNCSMVSESARQSEVRKHIVQDHRNIMGLNETETKKWTLSSEHSSTRSDAHTDTVTHNTNKVKIKRRPSDGISEKFRDCFGAFLCRTADQLNFVCIRTCARGHIDCMCDWKVFGKRLVLMMIASIGVAVLRCPRCYQGPAWIYAAAALEFSVDSIRRTK